MLGFIFPHTNKSPAWQIPPVSPSKSWDMHLWKSSGLELMPKGKSRAKWCDKRPPYLHARRMCQKLDCASNFEKNKNKNVAPFHWASNCAIDDNVCSSLHNASMSLVRSTHLINTIFFFPLGFTCTPFCWSFYPLNYFHLFYML